MFKILTQQVDMTAPADGDMSLLVSVVLMYISDDAGHRATDGWK